MKKGFLDGSISGDIPKEELSIFFNVNNIIVSQVNVHIVPFAKNHSFSLIGTKRYFFSKTFKLMSNLILSEIKHRFRQLQSMNFIP